MRADNVGDENVSFGSGPEARERALIYARLARGLDASGKARTISMLRREFEVSSDIWVLLEAEAKKRHLSMDMMVTVAFLNLLFTRPTWLRNGKK